MKARLTPDDLKRGDLVPPGWYPATIRDYEEKEAGTDKSTNCIFHFEIIDGPHKGVRPRVMFNEKALGFGKNLWKSLQFPYDEANGYDLSTELFKKTVGYNLMIFIKRGKSDRGIEFNDVQDFKPMS